MCQLAAVRGSRLALGTAAASLMGLMALTSTCVGTTNGTAGRDDIQEGEDPAAVVTGLPAEERLTGETTDALLLSSASSSAAGGAVDAPSATASRGSPPPVANRGDAASSSGAVPSSPGNPGRSSADRGGDERPSPPLSRRPSPASSSTSRPVSAAPPLPPPAPTSAAPEESRPARPTPTPTPTPTPPATREPAPATAGAAAFPAVASAATAAPSPQATTTAPRSAGIYLVRDDGRRERLEPAVVSQVVEGGGFFGPRRQTGVIRGLRAALRVTDHYQTFEFHLPGTAALGEVSNPNQFVLMQMFESDDYEEREMDFDRAGPNPDMVIPFDVDRLGPDSYHVTPTEPLGLGEFCFFNLESASATLGQGSPRPHHFRFWRRPGLSEGDEVPRKLINLVVWAMCAAVAAPATATGEADDAPPVRPTPVDTAAVPPGDAATTPLPGASPPPTRSTASPLPADLRSPRTFRVDAAVAVEPAHPSVGQRGRSRRRASATRRSVPRIVTGLALVAGGVTTTYTANGRLREIADRNTIREGWNSASADLLEGARFFDTRCNGRVFHSETCADLYWDRLLPLAQEMAALSEAHDFLPQLPDTGLFVTSSEARLWEQWFATTVDLEGDGAWRGTLYGGLAAAGVGALLATIWSDVPVLRSLRVRSAAGSIGVTTSVGW